MNQSADDQQLLSCYAAHRSQPAFVELVRRHIDLVYSIALRQLGGDAHLAQDVTQEVFVILAREAGRLSQRPVLEGWLYRAARYSAIDIARAESRRRAREHQAALMQETTLSPPVDPERLRPLLDDAISELQEVERDAVVLRYLKQRSYAEVGRHLRVTENTARMRVERALAKLQRYLARRGVTSSAAALAVSLANQPVLAAPAGLVATVSSAALASGGAGTGVAAAFMGMTKLQVGVVCAIVAGASVAFVSERRTLAGKVGTIALRRQEPATQAKQQARVAESQGAFARSRELAALRDEAATLQAELASLSRREHAVAGEARGELTFTGPYLESKQVEQQPHPVYQAVPYYPPELRRLKTPGKATVDLIVDAKGAVHNVRVVDMTDPAFGDSALEAVKRWQYEPAQKEGRPVAVHIQVPVIYQLEAKAPAATAAKTATAAPVRKPFVPWF